VTVCNFQLKTNKSPYNAEVEQPPNFLSLLLCRQINNRLSGG